MPRNWVKQKVRVSILLTLVGVISVAMACESSEYRSKINSEPPVPEVKLSAVEKDVKSMQTANFDYIFVFRRKDGAPFEGEDKTFLKANSPADTNRFLLSDDDKAVVAGSSYAFEAEQLKKLAERFLVENFSSAKMVEDANMNQSTNVQDKKNPAGNN